MMTMYNSLYVCKSHSLAFRGWCLCYGFVECTVDNGTCLCFGFQWKVSHQGKSFVWPCWGKVYLKMAHLKCEGEKSDPCSKFISENT